MDLQDSIDCRESTLTEWWSPDEVDLWMEEEVTISKHATAVLVATYLVGMITGLIVGMLVFLP